MHELPTEWTALCALVFLLGLKHGFDADHLATIDGLTRYNARHGRRFRPLLRRAVLARSWRRRVADRARGRCRQRAMGCARLARIVRRLDLDPLPRADWHRQSARGTQRVTGRQVVAPVGIKGRLLGRLNQASHPVTVGLVGALFARVVRYGQPVGAVRADRRRSSAASAMHSYWVCCSSSGCW